MNHDFNFEGGGYLRRIGASFLISFLYSQKIDQNRKDWEIISTKRTRISTINRSTRYHKDWINEVIKMNPSKLGTNKMKLPGLEIISMAEELKAFYEHQG